MAELRILNRINNLAASGKVQVGGTFITLILTIIVVVIVETRKEYLQKDDEIFLSCTESGNIYQNGEKIKSFLACSIANINERKSWSYPNIGSSVSSNNVNEKNSTENSTYIKS